MLFQRKARTVAITVNEPSDSDAKTKSQNEYKKLFHDFSFIIAPQAALAALHART
jgi:hypothetical protein